MPSALYARAWYSSSPLMSRHFAFTDYLAAYEYIDTHQETTMKVLIDVDPSDD